MPYSQSTAHPFVDSRSLRASLGVDEAALDDIRAVGAALEGRIPDLVEDFYRWLEPLPEFAQFFADDGALLARVKSHQVAYWKDFLHAVVDDAYVERRRLVGQVHARIELGLFIYLQAMEFVSTWLVREVESNELLMRERSSASFSIRKLIHFDSAIVVHTYATRTADMLSQQRERLHRTATVMRAVTEGDLDHQLDVMGPDDRLGTSVNEMVRSLRGIAREMQLIASGDYSADVAPRSSRDALGAALQLMTRALRDADEKNKQHLRLIEGQAELAAEMSGNPSVSELSKNVLRYLCRALGAQVGVLYVVEQDGNGLRAAGGYAVSLDRLPRERWKFGEGLIGQAALDRRKIIVEDIPEDGLRIQWGSADTLPRSIAVLPLVHEEQVRGVIEVATLRSFSQLHLDLLDHASATVAFAIVAAETRAQIQQLLEESQAQAEELASQQEELRAVNEALERQTRELELQKESLVATETTLRQKAAELERASRYKSEFLANMSHELRTPLNSTLILAKLLMSNRDENLTAEQVNYAQNIYSAGNDLLTLINDILDLSKIEAGKVELGIESVETLGLIDDVRRRFDPLIADKGLTFSVSISEDCPREISTDPQRVLQILTNLLSNALKFTEDGTIHLRGERNGSREIAFSVEDTGIGIRPEHQDIIFDAFRQADGTTNRKFGGTGLGLSICRELASVLGGDIRLRSAPGQGSTFRLTLPIAQDETFSTASATRAQHVNTPVDTRNWLLSTGLMDQLAEDERAMMPSTPPHPVDYGSRQAKKHLLVVEDDAAQRHAISRLLVSNDVHVVAVSTAHDALATLQGASFDCMIIDLMLPEMNGFELLERIAENKVHASTPVIVYTATALSASEEQHLRRHSRSVIIKSTRSPERLVEEVHAFMHRVESERPPAMLHGNGPTPTKTRTFEGRRILLVEDDVRNIFALTSLLESHGVTVDVARNGIEATSRLDGGPPVDLVLMDVMMPEKDGITTTREIRSRQEDGWSSIPIIALTAKAMPDDRQRCLDAGANDYIAKPIDVDKLMSVLQVWMPT